MSRRGGLDHHQVGGSEPPVLAVGADYRPLAGGVGWLATITAACLPPHMVRGTSVHDTLHAVLEQIARVVHRQPQRVLIAHTLHGNPKAFMELAYQGGLMSCVIDSPLLEVRTWNDTAAQPDPCRVRECRAGQRTCCPSPAMAPARPSETTPSLPAQPRRSTRAARGLSRG